MIFKPTLLSLLRVVFGTLLILNIALTGSTYAQTAQKPDATESKAANNSEYEVPVRFRFVDVSGQPVPEAQVRFFVDNMYSDENVIIADSEGWITFPCSKEKYNQLQFFAVSKDEKLWAWEAYHAPVWGGLDDAAAGKKFILHKITRRIITGTVKDSDGKPVEGAYVGGGEDCPLLLYTKSKADGTFRFYYSGANHLMQVYAVKSGVGFAYHATEELYGWEGKTPPDKISDGPFNLVLDKPQTVQVRVTDEKGTPIHGAIVTSETIFVSTKEKPTVMKDFFRPLNLAPPVFFQKTNADGLATFDWIPTTNLKNLVFNAEGQKVAITMPDGTSKRFGESQDVVWNKKDPIVTIALQQRAKVKLKIVDTNGSPVVNVSAFLEWTSKSRPLSGSCVDIDENGEAEIFGNVGDVFDIYSVGFQEDDFVFPTVGNFNVGDGSEVKELKLTAKKGAKVFGKITDADGVPMKWSEQSGIRGWEINNSEVAKPQSQDRAFGVNLSKEDATSYEIFLPSGTFTFKLTLKYEFEQKTKPGYQLGDEKTITVGDEPVQLDLKLHN